MQKLLIIGPHYEKCKVQVTHRLKSQTVLEDYYTITDFKSKHLNDNYCELNLVSCPIPIGSHLQASKSFKRSSLHPADHKTSYG